MNRNPGRNVLLFVCLFCLLGILHAEDLQFKATLDHTDPYLKAPVILSVDINQTNPDIVLLFQFDVVKSDAYLIKQIDALHDDTMYHTHHHYLYRIYPLKTGPVTIDFNLVKRITDERKVAYSASGDRDDFKKLETKDITLHPKPLTMHVKPLPENTMLVGDFTIHRTLGRTKAQAYEPIPLKIILRGRGYPPIVERILPKIEGVTVFSEKPDVKQTVSRGGIRYTVTYTLSLSAKKSFILPALSLQAFNPYKAKSYTLTLPAEHFTITSPDTKSLVDRTDNPKPFRTDLSWLGSLLGYLAAFFAGYLTALAWKWKRKVTKGTEEPLKEKVEACKDDKALFQVLMAADDRRFKGAVAALERTLYKKEKSDFKTIKKEILEQLQ